jgi:hypothetical protein
MGLNALMRVELIDIEAMPLCGDALRDICCRYYIRSGHLSRRAIHLRHQHDLGTKRFEHSGTLPAISRRHGDDERMPQCRAYNGKARPHVAARYLDDGSARRQAPICPRSKKDRPRRPVLNAAAGLHELGFGQDPPRSGVDAIQGD